MNRAVQDQCAGNGRRERLERLELCGFRLTGPAVNDAQSAKDEVGFVTKRDAGVKPDVRIAGDQRVVDETSIAPGILNDKRPSPMGQQMCTKRYRARSFGEVQADA